MEFFHPTMAPFTIALMIVALIAVLEVGGLLFGVAFSGLVDAALPDFELDAELDAEVDTELDGAGAGLIGGLLSWLGLGKTPFLIVLAAFLLSFGVAGVLLQNAVNSAFGFFPPALIAAPIGLLAALPATHFLSGAVAKVFPKEQTDAVSVDSFVGRVAVIIRGEARQGAPAEAKMKDAKGATQYLLVEPDAQDAKFVAGDEVLLIEKAGPVFRAVINQSELLSAD